MLAVPKLELELEHGSPPSPLRLGSMNYFELPLVMMKSSKHAVSDIKAREGHVRECHVRPEACILFIVHSILQSVHSYSCSLRNRRSCHGIFDNA